MPNSISDALHASSLFIFTETLAGNSLVLQLWNRASTIEAVHPRLEFACSRAKKKIGLFDPKAPSMIFGCLLCKVFSPSGRLVLPPLWDRTAVFLKTVQCYYALSGTDGSGPTATLTLTGQGLYLLPLCVLMPGT